VYSRLVASRSQCQCELVGRTHVRRSGHSESRWSRRGRLR
jgi:hypothetical protein